MIKQISRHRKITLTGYSVLPVLVVVLMILTGCIKNDIPYPRIQPNITELTCDGLLKPAEIDSASRFVVLTFDETVDMTNIEITHYAVSEGASIVKGDLSAPIDLTKYYIVTLALYQNYDWVIQGVQTIERYFTVENQVGDALIDVTGRRVVVNVVGSLENVKVLTAKLGPTNSTMTPALAGETINLTSPVEVSLNIHGREEQWTIHGKETESTVQTVRADAWTQVAWVYGAAIDGRDNGVEYRKSGDTEWTRVPADWVTHTGGTFCARIKNLEPLTTYAARAYSDSEYASEVSFTTGAIEQVPNSSLSEWSLSGKVWNPWAEGDESYWDTGNKGATTLGDSNSVPTTDTSSGSGQAAMLQTKFVGVGVVGKLAAGNIFTGSYVRTDGTNGVLSMGREFTQRPTKVRGYLKYTSVPISHSNTTLAYMKGQPDTCCVWAALIDSNEAYEIRTNPNNAHYFDPKADEVVAYGRFQSGESIPNYRQFEFEFEYVATNRVPRFIILVASASKYGDYFTGGNGSVLYIDDLELVYDY